ncbi:DUF998 domain-containing protein [Ktedonosporobacter rubrisoli]|uniref:DUF998 domain-containing protein n=1 Tax=Ktedonosporobacter rubrisoli TaxID=2509675 RepID=A0A4P6JZK1_KTERU|nr:DUF998 domain-containing protein [Ktedonosporobacter rubrisoli]QBD81174.1 DUF998 domain-containing protein [Ktedonosporobacter rubrisoli]
MAQSVAITKPISNGQTLFARLSIAAGTLFVLLLLSLHVLEPEFDPTWRFISEYALGSFGWMMHLAFFLLATSLLSAALALFSQVRNVLGYIGLAILGLAAVGLFMASIFTTDTITTSQAALSFSGSMHDLGAALDYTPIAALLLSFVLVRQPAWRPVRVWLFLTAGITLVAMVAFMLMLPHDGKFGPGVLAGLFGRFLIVSYLGWLLTVGLHILRLHRRAA